MKKIEAIIRKSKFEDVKNALHEVGVIFFSFWDVTGVGNEQKGSNYRGIPYSTNTIQRRMLSIVVPDEIAEKTIEAIMDAAQTGEIGDGKVFVSEIQEAYRIRTREKNDDAIL